MYMRFYLILTLFLGACALGPQGNMQQTLTDEILLNEDTVWQGEVLIDGKVTVATGVRLDIQPGTVVRFVRKDQDRDGLGDATIIVKGSLFARGTEGAPIRFLSAQPEPQPGDWLEIRSDFAKQLEFDWCEFRDSAYTLHAHFTRGHLRNSHLHHNIDGSRLGRSKFLVEHNLIENNSGKGINFRDSAVTLRKNIIRNNRVGVFLFEQPGTSVITANNLYGNGLNLQLGDFFSADISLSGNWWGTRDETEIDRLIHDRTDDPEIGRVLVNPAADWVEEAGARRQVKLELLWQISTEGFVDATPLPVGEQVLFASWDGNLRAVSASGVLQWQADTGDVIDAGMAVGDKLYGQNWSRQLYAADLKTGETELLFSYPESPADDHRQGGVVLTPELILLPAWNGTLYALSRETHQLLWQVDVGQPLRSYPLVMAGRIYTASGNGKLSALDFAGNILWQLQLSAPLLAAPISLGEDLLLLDKEGNLERIDAEGKKVWRYALQQTCFYAAPAGDADDLFVGTAAGELWKFEAASGDLVWRRKLGAATYATPTLSAQLVLVGDNAGVLHVVDRESGAELMTQRVGGPIQTQPVLTGNRLYFGSRDRNLYAFKLIQGADE